VFNKLLIFEGQKFGVGSYFAKETSLATTYSDVDVQGHMYMMQVRVVTGEYCVGNESMKYPPVKPSNPAEEFDTTVNDEQNPTIFVTYHDAAAYPDYIIKYI